MFRHFAEALYISFNEFRCTVVVVQYCQHPIHYSVIDLPDAYVDAEQRVYDSEEEVVDRMSNRRSYSRLMLEALGWLAFLLSWRSGLRFRYGGQVGP